jgi:hypothetical protein
MVRKTVTVILHVFVELLLMQAAFGFSVIYTGMYTVVDRSTGTGPVGGHAGVRRQRHSDCDARAGGPLGQPPSGSSLDCDEWASGWASPSWHWAWGVHFKFFKLLALLAIFWLQLESANIFNLVEDGTRSFTSSTTFLRISLRPRPNLDSKT